MTIRIDARDVAEQIASAAARLRRHVRERRRDAAEHARVAGHDGRMQNFAGRAIAIYQGRELPADAGLTDGPTAFAGRVDPEANR